MSEHEVLGPEKLWGAPAIAQATGLSPDTIYRLADQPGVPIYRPPGTNRLCAFRSELRRWQRTKPKIPDET
jgi:predicted DNA-binding transcriptional regulator AlpA